ncbi:glycosyltransferase, partial [Pseudothermotoga sp.]|uniref:glycosyltransferase n=1 Tax=Pseudothermotoga sp. TaxID=2033661 RepID=UPI000E9AEA7C
MKANLEVLGLSCLLSVAMIVKDEESNIRRALDSVKDIADEIVVVDTGSVDNTPDIVRKYTDKLYF